jgi:hypothetical protein
MTKRAVTTIMLFGCSLVAGCNWFSQSDGLNTGPATRTTLPQPGRAAFFVVVERGQTIDSIATTYRTAASDIRVANKLRLAADLKPGMLLEVPLRSRHAAVKSTQQPSPRHATMKTAKRTASAKSKQRHRVKTKHVRTLSRNDITG